MLCLSGWAHPGSLPQGQHDQPQRTDDVKNQNGSMGTVHPLWPVHSKRRWRAPGLVQVWILCQFWWSARYSTPAQQTAYGTCGEHQKHHRSTHNLELRMCILTLFGKQECRQYLWAASNLSLIAGGLKTQVRLPLPTSLLSCSHLYPKATVTRILPSPYLISNTP